jgi:hypothetical protein
MDSFQQGQAAEGIEELNQESTRQFIEWHLIPELDANN